MGRKISHKKKRATEKRKAVPKAGGAAKKSMYEKRVEKQDRRDARKKAKLDDKTNRKIQRKEAKSQIKMNRKQLKLDARANRVSIRQEQRSVRQGQRMEAMSGIFDGIGDGMKWGLIGAVGIGGVYLMTKR